jgi:hypothetical protein
VAGELHPFDAGSWIIPSKIIQRRRKYDQNT